MPCETVTVLGTGINVEFTQYEVSGGVEEVRIDYTVKSNYDVEIALEVAVGIDHDGNGLLEGQSEIVNFDDHTIPPGGTSSDGRTVTLDGIPEGGTSEINVCAQLANVSLLG